MNRSAKKPKTKNSFDLASNVAAHKQSPELITRRQQPSQKLRQGTTKKTVDDPEIYIRNTTKRIDKKFGV